MVTFAAARTPAAPCLSAISQIRTSASARRCASVRPSSSVGRSMNAWSAVVTVSAASLDSSPERFTRPSNTFESLSPSGSTGAEPSARAWALNTAAARRTPLWSPRVARSRKSFVQEFDPGLDHQMRIPDPSGHLAGRGHPQIAQFVELMSDRSHRKRPVHRAPGEGARPVVLTSNRTGTDVRDNPKPHISQGELLVQRWRGSQRKRRAAMTSAPTPQASRTATCDAITPVPAAFGLNTASSNLLR